MSKFSVIGKNIPRVDGVAKATGRALYTDDIKMPGMLVGKLLRSPYAHARIIKIDTSQAEKLPGVKAVITGMNPVCQKYTRWRIRPQLADVTPIATDTVRFRGEEVAGVAAVDEDTALKALGLIKVEYEELPGVFNIDEAMAENAPLVHEEFAGNINPDVTRKLEFGDVEQGFAEADHIRVDKFRTQTVIHGYMEPHAALAVFDAPSKLTIYTTTGTPYYLKGDIAFLLGLKEENVRIIKPHMGGNFGGRNIPQSLQFCAAMLAMKAGQPVNITYDRLEEFTVGYRRHAVQLELKTGVKKDGTIIAKQVTAYLDGGAYNGFGPTSTFLAGLYHSLVYRFPHYKFVGHRVYTNNPVSIGMRGFCGPQAFFAVESQMDMIAEDLGIDPIEIRMKNAIRTGDVVPGIAEISSSGLYECLAQIQKKTGWVEKRAKGGQGQGIGVAASAHFSGANFNFYNTPYAFSATEVRAHPDGTVTLLTLAPEVGQGSDTALSQILAEELGIPIDRIKLLGTDTDIAPVDLGAYSSRITFMTGNAVIDAAKDLKKQLFNAAAVALGVGVQEGLEAKDACIRVRASKKKSLSFAEAVLAAMRASGGMVVTGRGSYTPRGKYISSSAFTFGAATAEVDVDRETGRVKVSKITVADDCGVNINPMAVEGQLAGAVQMGLGYAVSEHLLNDKGRVLNDNFMDYKMPSSLDMPEIEHIAVEVIDPLGPYGAKEAGEGGIQPIAPSITNAVYHAVGYRAHELPLSPEKIIGHIKMRENK
ncbi:xanthine dehydrogenase family protein molybdopterin-binding subunit [Chloroflexota bacterium]